MSTDDRILRLENALATLAELSADHDRRVARLEQAFVNLVELTQNHDDRIDRFSAAQAELGSAQAQLSAAQAKLSAAQADSERKIAALADAQINTEEVLKNFAARVDEALERLAESQSHTDQRLDALIEIVRGGRDGESPGG
jgi:septal ring factor EnvC (AmiA/AmiB activator)